MILGIFVLTLGDVLALVAMGICFLIAAVIFIRALILDFISSIKRKVKKCLSTLKRK